MVGSWTRGKYKKARQICRARTSSKHANPSRPALLWQRRHQSAAHATSLPRPRKDFLRQIKHSQLKTRESAIAFTSCSGCFQRNLGKFRNTAVVGTELSRRNTPPPRDLGTDPTNTPILLAFHVSPPLGSTCFSSGSTCFSSLAPSPATSRSALLRRTLLRLHLRKPPAMRRKA